MATSDENPQGQYVAVRTSLEKVLTARISKSCAFGSEPLGAVGATGDIRCLVTSIIDGFSEDRLIELGPTVIREIERDGRFPTEMASDSELTAVGLRLAQCYERSTGRTIPEFVVEAVRDHTEDSLMKKRRRSQKIRQGDLRYCGHCQLPLLRREVEETLNEWAPRFVHHYESTIRSILEASMDHHKLLGILFLDVDSDDAEIRTLCVLPADCRESVLRVAVVVGFLQTAINARRSDVAQDALRIGNNLDLARLVESDDAFVRFFSDEDDPVLEAALDAAFEACGYS